MDLEGYGAIEGLGESGTALLLRARHLADGTSVVIKLLKSEYPTPEEVARLAHEHRIVEGLRLDGVVRPLRIERFKHRVGLILEDFGGVSLRSMIGPGGMATETFLRLAIHIEGNMGVVFSDLRAFTTLSERLSPDETFCFLNQYLREVGPVTRAHGGYIDKYVGDAILAIFPDGPDDALRAALAMQRQVDVFNQAREKAGSRRSSSASASTPGRWCWASSARRNASRARSSPTP
jgi:hypothetical protein